MLPIVKCWLEHIVKYAAHRIKHRPRHHPRTGRRAHHAVATKIATATKPGLIWHCAVIGGIGGLGIGTGIATGVLPGWAGSPQAFERPGHFGSNGGGDCTKRARPARAPVFPARVRNDRADTAAVLSARRAAASGVRAGSRCTDGAAAASARDNAAAAGTAEASARTGFARAAGIGDRRIHRMEEIGMSALLPSEAEERLCPQLLQFRDETAADPWAGCRCQGPRCQAWRWVRRLGSPGNAAELRRPGYCGLAGLPDTELPA